MKKFLSLILSLIACFMLFSCDDEEASSTPPVVDDGDPYEYKEVDPHDYVGKKVGMKAGTQVGVNKVTRKESD